MELSLDAARGLLLRAQGLITAPTRPAAKDDVLAAIRMMGGLQIDTISVVARSPYLVLWSRLGAFEQQWLDELLDEGALFEYWSRAACFLPIEDFALYRRRMLDAADKYSSHEGHSPAHQEAVHQVLAHVHARGAVRSAEFARTDGKGGGWWDWKPEKRALEHLFNAGALMIARRAGFQRVYDLRERVLPDWDDAQTPTLAEVQRPLTLKALQALGVATPRWTASYFPNHLRLRETASLLETLADAGLVRRVTLEGVKGPAYIHADHHELAEQASAGALCSSVTTLLSPFDPIVWDRTRAAALFGFHYRIETYTPAPKRRYGYFTLPILHQGQLVGRLDPKAHRRQGIFEVKAVHLEPGVPVTEEFVHALAGTLRSFADWHKTPQVVVQASDPPTLAPALQAVLAKEHGG